MSEQFDWAYRRGSSLTGLDVRFTGQRVKGMHLLRLYVARTDALGITLRPLTGLSQTLCDCKNLNEAEMISLGLVQADSLDIAHEVASRRLLGRALARLERKAWIDEKTAHQRMADFQAYRSAFADLPGMHPVAVGKRLSDAKIRDDMEPRRVGDRRFACAVTGRLYNDWSCLEERSFVLQAEDNRSARQIAIALASASTLSLLFELDARPGRAALLLPFLKSLTPRKADDLVRRLSRLGQEELAVAIGKAKAHGRS
jgi:hypothetical protein